jgi:hypothetical protein
LGRAAIVAVLAKVAFDAGQFGKARDYAALALETATNPKDWHYGNNIYYGHMILGRLALRDGDVAEARRRLLAAAHTPGSPTLRSFGPNVSLAKDLLERGEPGSVLEYFALCREFWKMGGDRLDAWTATVSRGGMPDFGANLLY